LGRLEEGLALVRSFSTASATLLCLHRWVVPLLLDHTEFYRYLHCSGCTTKAHRAVIFAIVGLRLSCFTLLLRAM